MNLAQWIDLLGVSERDPRIELLVKEAGIKWPLKRPKRDETDIGFDVKGRPLALNFSLAESVYPSCDDFAEGELILDTIFLMTNNNKKTEPFLSQLPIGITPNTTRADARRLLGEPDWVSPVVKNDRWDKGPIQLMLSYDDDDESAPYQISISVNPAAKA